MSVAHQRPPESGVRVDLSFAWLALAAMVPIERLLPELGLVTEKLWESGVSVFLLLSLYFTRPVRVRYMTPWLLMAVGALAGGVLSPGVLRGNLPIAIQMAALFLCGPIALRTQLHRRPDLGRKMIKMFLFVQTISALVGVLQLFGMTVLDQAAIQGRSPGLSTHPNVLGIMAAVALLVLIHERVKRNKGVRNRTYDFLLFINGAALLATGSFTAILSFFAGVLVLFAATGTPWRKLVIASLFMTGALVLLLHLPFVSGQFKSPTDRIKQISGHTYLPSTANDREDTFAGAIASIKSNPIFGTGIGSQGATIADDTVVHNLALRAWTQGGLLLGLAVVTLLIAAITLVVEASLKQRLGLAAAVLTTFLGFAMTSAFYNQAYYWMPVMFAWTSFRPRRVRSLREQTSSFAVDTRNKVQAEELLPT